MEGMPLLFILLWFSPTATQSDTETKVLEGLQQLANDQEDISFSDLYNDERFSSQEKELLGRLYEIFFEIPGFLKTEYESTGEIPTLEHLGLSFGISLQAVKVLLTVMEADPRMPWLFSRDQHSQEIESLRLAQIEAFVNSRGTGTRMTRWEGRPLPPFELETFQGGPFQSQDLLGKNTLIYFWFTGCPPCTRISPLLAQLDRKYSNSNFEVIGFNADRTIGVTTTDEDRREYVQELKLHFRNVQIDRPTWEAFGSVKVFPTLFFVAPDGSIFRHMINYQDRETLEGVIRELTQAY